MTAELLEAADAFNEAPKRLREAIIEAAKQDATAIEIAKTINFAYSVDYVARIIREAGVPRTRGRRKRSSSDSLGESPE